MDFLRYFEQQQVKDVSRPSLRAGDIVRVETKIEEGDKTRLQVFEGTVLGVRGGGPSTTFTVRRETGRFAVERIFPLYSPIITSIEIAKRQKVRRAKLTYLRQEGRRRVKEDERAMQQHVKEEGDKKRLLEEAKKRAEEEAERAEREKVKAEAAAKAVEEAPAEEKPAE
jgi:large subunit ribosomal protein L19